MISALPAALVANVQREWGGRGSAWLHDLPRTLEAFAERWSLSLGPAYPELSYHYVTPATRADGSRCVLKVGVPHSEMASEIQALRIWDGQGVARLLEADADAGGLLLERLEPGTMLAELAGEDDDDATLIAADIMRSLWRPAPTSSEAGTLIRLESWFHDLLDGRTADGGDGPLTPALVDGAQRLANDLLSSTDKPVLLHGDLHHFNILRAQRQTWLAIDPKGMIGDRGFDVAAFLRNPSPKSAARHARRRLDILCSELGLDRGRTRNGCFAEAVLNVCWSQDASAEKLREKVAWAELMASL